MGQAGYVVAAVFVIWIALGAYLLWIAGLLRRAQRDVAALEERLEQAEARDRDEAERRPDRAPAAPAHSPSG